MPNIGLGFVPLELVARKHAASPRRRTVAGLRWPMSAAASGREGVTGALGIGSGIGPRLHQHVEGEIAPGADRRFQKAVDRGSGIGGDHVGLSDQIVRVREVASALQHRERLPEFRRETRTACTASWPACAPAPGTPAAHLPVADRTRAAGQAVRTGVRQAVEHVRGADGAAQIRPPRPVLASARPICKRCSCSTTRCSGSSPTSDSAVNETTGNASMSWLWSSVRKRPISLIRAKESGRPSASPPSS